MPALCGGRRDEPACGAQSRGALRRSRRRRRRVARGGGGQRRGAARLQRRRQDDDAQRHRRPRPHQPWQHRMGRRGLALSPEGWRLFVGQTVEQNLRLGASALGDRRRLPALLERAYAIFPRLAERRRQRAGTLSGGERQMLAMARALMSEPKLLMLDEPSLGLAPAVVDALYETLHRLHREGLTLLLAEQSVPLALDLADYAYVLQTGRTVLSGKAGDLAQDPQVQHIYLGIAAP